MRRSLSLLSLLCVFTTAHAQDTLRLDPISRFPATRILAFSDSLIVSTVETSEAALHIELNVTDFSDPSHPSALYREYPLTHQYWGDDAHYRVGMEFSDAVIIGNRILAGITRHNSYGDIAPFGFSVGPLQAVGKQLGVEEAGWEFTYQDSFYYQMDAPFPDGDPRRYPGEMLLHRDHLIFNAGSWGIQVYDFTNPDQPQLDTTLQDSCFKMTIIGDCLVLASDGGDDTYLRVYDITDPAVPTRVGDLRRISLGGSELQVDGQHLLLPHPSQDADSSSIQVVDIAGDAAPRVAGQIPIRCAGPWWDFRVTGRRIYLWKGQTVDCFDLSENLVATYRQTVVVSEEIQFSTVFTAQGRYFFLSDRFPAWRNPLASVYDSEPDEVSGDGRDALPTQFEITETHPNPFNSEVRISYTMPKAQQVRVDIVDINGRIVSELASERVSAWSHTLVWKADGFAAGTYFLKVTAGSDVKTAKLLLVK